MSKAEILAELPKLKAEERTMVFERLCELQERDLLHGLGPTAEEKKLLDQALAEFESDGQRGEPWRDVLHRIQASPLTDEQKALLEARLDDLDEHPEKSIPWSEAKAQLKTRFGV